MKKSDRLARAARARALLAELDGEPSISPTQETPPPARSETRRGEKAQAEVPAGRVRLDPKPTATARRASGRVSLPADAPRAILEPPPKLPVPKNWPGGPPKRGDMVFWNGQRMFVERAPKHWGESTFVSISDHCPRDGDDPKTHQPWVQPEKRESFYAYADSLTKIDAEFNRLAARLPTIASVARAERAKTGSRDVGDEIATLLRACDSLGDVYKAASKYLGDAVANLEAKYAKLNPGQQRMVLGNRMRAKWKKEHV